MNKYISAVKESKDFEKGESVTAAHEAEAEILDIKGDRKIL